jgi:homoserine O-acetyltransferase/O-succinyltransferase
MSIDQEIFELKSAPLQSGIDFRGAKISYKTYGQLAADKSNVIVVPSGYTLAHNEVDWLTSAGKVLDTSRWFVIRGNHAGEPLVFVAELL